MSGFAHIIGFPDGPPTLPAFALGDGVAGVFGAAAVMFAIWHRDVGGGPGQVIDMSLYEPLFYILGPQVTVYDQLGWVQTREGNRQPFGGAPRNAYQCADGRWVAFSANAPAIVERLVGLLGMEDDERFSDGVTALQHGEELDALVGEWIGKHDRDYVLEEFTRRQAAIGPVYSAKDLLEDAQFQARDDIVSVDDEELGPVRMQGLVPRFSSTPGAVAHAGRRRGQDNSAVYGEMLGLQEEELRALAAQGAI